MSQHETPQLPYPEHEEAAATNVDERRGRFGRLAAGVLAVGIGAGGISLAVHELGSDEAFAHQGEATTVSERFNCELLEVVDLNKRPEEALFPGMSHLKKFTTVNLTVRTETKNDPETQSVLKRYEDDDTIWWTEPAISGSVYDSDKTLDKMQTTISPRRIPFEDGVYSMPVGLHTDYPEDTTVLITLNNEANVIGGENSVESTQVCGAIVFRDGVWQASTELPNVEPATIPHQD